MTTLNYSISERCSMRHIAQLGQNIRGVILLTILKWIRYLFLKVFFQLIFAIFLKILVQFSKLVNLKKQQSSKIKIWFLKVWIHRAFFLNVSSARFSGSSNKDNYYNKVSFKKLDLFHCMHSKGLFDICTFYMSMH